MGCLGTVKSELKFTHLRIEIHILSLYWMMKTFVISMSVKLLRNIKIANVFHHPVLKYD